MNILLAGILLINICIFGSIIVAFLIIRSVSREFREFITPQAENTPSRIAMVFQSISEMFGRSMVASLKGFMMGAKSGEVRQANAETGEAIGASPIGALVDMLPKSVKRSLIKNPQLLDMAMGFMAKQGHPGSGLPGSGQLGDNHNHQSSSPVKFKL